MSVNGVGVQLPDPVSALKYRLQMTTEESRKNVTRRERAVDKRQRDEDELEAERKRVVRFKGIDGFSCTQRNDSGKPDNEMKQWSMTNVIQGIQLYRNICQRYSVTLDQCEQVNYFRLGQKAHECGEPCRFYDNYTQCRSVFLCASSANLHCCTLYNCEHRVEKDGHSVCMLTGMAHATERESELEYSLYTKRARGRREEEDVEDCGYDMEAIDEEADPTKLISDADKSMDRKNETALETSHRKKMESLERKQHNTIQKARLERQAVYFNAMSDMLSKQDYLPSPKQKELLIGHLERIWELVNCSSLFGRMGMIYTPLYHCLVVMFLSKQGFHVDKFDKDSGVMRRFVVVAKLDFMEENMPQRNDCSPYPSKKITDAEKNLKTYTADCSVSDLTRLAVSCSSTVIN